jgi:hypothetical protein
MSQYKAKIDKEKDELLTQTCHETKTLQNETEIKIEDMKKEFLVKNTQTE